MAERQATQPEVTPSSLPSASPCPASEFPHYPHFPSSGCTILRLQVASADITASQRGRAGEQMGADALQTTVASLAWETRRDQRQGPSICIPAAGRPASTWRLFNTIFRRLLPVTSIFVREPLYPSLSPWILTLAGFLLHKGSIERQAVGCCL